MGWEGRAGQESVSEEVTTGLRSEEDREERWRTCSPDFGPGMAMLVESSGPVHPSELNGKMGLIDVSRG